MHEPDLYACQRGEHTVGVSSNQTGHLEQMKASRAEHRGERAASCPQINQPSRAEETISSSAGGRASRGVSPKSTSHFGQKKSLRQRPKGKPRCISQINHPLSRVQSIDYLKEIGQITGESEQRYMPQINQPSRAEKEGIGQRRKANRGISVNLTIRHRVPTQRSSYADENVSGRA